MSSALRSPTPSKSTRNHPKILKTKLPWFEEEVKQRKQTRSPSKQSYRTDGDVYDLPEVHPDVQLELVECSVCSRKFGSDRIEQHEEICKRNSARVVKRTVFDSQQARLRGTEFKRYNTGSGGGGSDGSDSDDTWKSSSGGRASSVAEASPKRRKDGEKPKWLIEHEKLVENMRSSASKGSGRKKKKEQELQEGEDGRVQCPHCQRRFIRESAEKHIPSCKEQALRDRIRKRNREQLKTQSRAASAMGGASGTPDTRAANRTEVQRRSHTSLGMNRGSGTRAKRVAPKKLVEEKQKARSAAAAVKRNLADQMDTVAGQPSDTTPQPEWAADDDAFDAEVALTNNAGNADVASPAAEESPSAKDVPPKDDDESTSNSTSTKQVTTPKAAPKVKASSVQNTRSKQSQQSRTPAKRTPSRATPAKSTPTKATPAKSTVVKRTPARTPAKSETGKLVGDKPTRSKQSQQRKQAILKSNAKTPKKQLHGVESNPEHIKNRSNRPSRNDDDKEAEPIHSTTSTTTTTTDDNPTDPKASAPPKAKEPSGSDASSSESDSESETDESGSESDSSYEWVTDDEEAEEEQDEQDQAKDEEGGASKER